MTTEQKVERNYMIGIIAGVFLLHLGLVIGLGAANRLPHDVRGFFHLSRGWDLFLVVLIAALTIMAFKMYGGMSQGTHWDFATMLVPGLIIGAAVGYVLQHSRVTGLWTVTCFALALGFLVGRGTETNRVVTDQAAFVLAFALAAGLVAGLWTALTIVFFAIIGLVFAFACAWAGDKLEKMG